MGSNTSIGGFLASLGVTRTVYKSSLERAGADRKTMVAAWNPNAPFNPGDPGSFERRYGFVPGPTGPSAGSLTGERVSDDLLLAVARDPSNPLSLADNAAYRLQPGDHEDAEYGSLDGVTAVWDSFFVPALQRLGGTGGTGPVPPPGHTSTPSPPSPPVTNPTTPPAGPPRDPVLVPPVSPQIPNPFAHPWLGRVPYSRMVKAFGGRVAWPFETYVRQHQGEEEVLTLWLKHLDADPQNPLLEQLRQEFGGG
jgi:hypothetical protein